ncbi:terpenoid cyclases/protein prenyltransferase alpha-alpha toroid [Chaetomidium leptoderma]|uniref:Protein farnesyltransferase subunit beta n=1 Tax=Chaetomidium leptoderma TaxID=669021 RepID=A0AAN6VNS2_9PEZI|nr:terpenoid cyclases/protein prenyltransferase alpha-alpha toroid [Chaetomidium leptoderma]
MATQPRRPSPTISPAQPSPDSDAVDEEIAFDRGVPGLMIPDLFTQLPPLRDTLVTATSVVQDETVEVCLPFLGGEDGAVEYNEHGVPRLDREKHIKFLHQSLGKLPGRFVAADASRPWFLYWCLSALTMLGEDVTSYQESIAETARSMQNDTGGFGGGGRQLSHMATTYAVVLSLALVGGEEAYELVDRKAMWRWLCTLKQPDGGFQVCLGGEEDIRGAYCAAVIISLLRLPLDLTPESPAYTGDDSVNLFTGVADYVRRCQTFEGGISGQPNAEAHGAYAFCALGCLALLDHPGRSIPSYLDVPRLIAWLSSRQYAPEGGFSGRTNKLVDGCYSHWVGGCFPLIEACLNSSTTTTTTSGSRSSGGSVAAEDAAATAATTTSRTRLAPAEESLFSREGLIRYILCCCQDQTKRGGLRDKPEKMSDAYHSCYVLSGLSSAQHQWELDDDNDNDNDLSEPAEEADAADAAAAAEAVWAVLPYLDGLQVFDNKDRVRPIHPVYAIPQQSVRAMKEYFRERQGGF